MKATWMRDTKDGEGGIYRLDTPYRSDNRDWHYVVVRCHEKHEVAFMIFPAMSLLTLCELVDGKYKKHKATDPEICIDGKCLSQRAMLARIGYEIA